MTLHDVLIEQGYRLVEDAWATDGRQTYRHDEGADRSHLHALRSVIAHMGWTSTPNKLRSFTIESWEEEIEIEPGGSEVSGHFLHRLKICP